MICDVLPFYVWFGTVFAFMLGGVAGVIIGIFYILIKLIKIIKK